MVLVAVSFGNCLNDLEALARFWLAARSGWNATGPSASLARVDLDLGVVRLDFELPDAVACRAIRPRLAVGRWNERVRQVVRQVFRGPHLSPPVGAYPGNSRQPLSRAAQTRLAASSFVTTPSWLVSSPAFWRYATADGPRNSTKSPGLPTAAGHKMAM